MKTIDALLQHKIMGLVRTNDQVTGQAMADAMVNAGISAIEITLTTPGALDIVESLANNKNLVVGVGTVLNKKDVKSAAKAGAKFIVSPNTDVDVIEKSRDLDLISMPGIATATEVGNAINAGADILKLFPASTYGPSHLKALRDPYPNLLWCPTGGITLGSVDDWFAAGANLIGLGGPLTKGGLDKVKENVIAFMGAVSSASKVG
ncbi:MAG: bifunctional 4-hydroxy-2-oxoglutarate aldolase/2-dehydro-3-deoxy-phosphogluconate aldolase [Actinobacteria bacterium]|nr:bifunctional 4-hydroxy-2-oxoglutarate aldolase/2-dehydro-3-deoxy-phosphogluconate aldolase [Actinomycetota bacterium]